MSQDLIKRLECLTNENCILDIPDLNRFKIGDEVVCDATEKYDHFEGVIIGIELRRKSSINIFEPDITILHDGDLITDGFKPRDLRIAILKAKEAQDAQ